MKNNKIYKSLRFNNNNMLPGDLNGRRTIAFYNISRGLNMATTKFNRKTFEKEIGKNKK